MKQPLKKLLSLVLALAMLASVTAVMTVGASAAFPLIVGETEISITESRSGTGWGWDHTTKTLTLTNAALENTDLPAICLPAGATIVLNGRNTVTASRIQGWGDLTFSGNGTLTVTAPDHTYAIAAQGEILLNGLSFTSPTGVHVKHYPDDGFTMTVEADDITPCTSVTIGTAAPSGDSDPTYQVTVKLLGNQAVNVFSSGSNANGGNTQLNKDCTSITIPVTTKQVILSAKLADGEVMAVSCEKKQMPLTLDRETGITTANVKISHDTTVAVSILKRAEMLSLSDLQTPLDKGQMIYGVVGQLLTDDEIKERFRKNAVPVGDDAALTREEGITVTADACKLAGIVSVDQTTGVTTLATSTRLGQLDTKNATINVDGNTITVPQNDIELLRSVAGKDPIVAMRKVTDASGKEVYVIDGASNESNVSGGTAAPNGMHLINAGNPVFTSIDQDSTGGFQIDLALANHRTFITVGGNTFTKNENTAEASDQTILTVTVKADSAVSGEEESVGTTSAIAKKFTLWGAAEDGTQLLLTSEGSALVVGASAAEIASAGGGTVLAAATNETVDTAVLDRFTDAAAVPEAQKATIAALVTAGIINGTLDGKLNLPGELTANAVRTVVVRETQLAGGTLFRD